MCRVTPAHGARHDDSTPKSGTATTRDHCGGRRGTLHGFCKRSRDVAIASTSHPHAVQFYETDAFLVDAVTRFVADGLAIGEPAVVIATAAHRALIAQRLAATGIDVARAIERGRLVMLDALDTLASFMIDGTPDRERFFATVGGTLDRIATATGATRARAYGEMVDHLWRSGQPAAAIRLEELWNELRAQRDLSLLSAYVMDSFYAVPPNCERHSQVLAPERSRPDHVTALVAEITRRTELELALRTSEQAARAAVAELEDFLENAVVPIHRVAPDGIIQWANRAELELLGYTADEYVGTSVENLHVDPAVPADIFARLRRGETVRDVEVQVRAKDGTMRWLQVSSAVQRRGDAIVATLCFSRDVTALKQAEADRDAIDHAMKLVTAELELDRLVKRLTEEAARLCHAEHGEFLSDPGAPSVALASKLEIPVVGPAGESLGRLVFGHSQPNKFTARCERLLTAIARQASTAILNARLYEAERAARTAAETAERQTAILHRVTSALSRALGADEAAKIVIHEARTLIGAEAGSVLLLDEDGAFERLIIDGAPLPPPDQLRDLTIGANMPVCEAARTGQLVWVAGADAIATRYPHLVALRDAVGAVTWGAVPIVFEGRTLGSIGFRCSKEQQLSDEERTILLAIGRQCGQALERARLTELTQAARADAERANRAKDEFLAMLGHELRNPLAPILTAVQLMRLRGDDTSVREQHIIERQVAHLIHLVDDLLDISRITRGKVQLDKRPLHAGAIVTKAVEIASPQIADRNHRITVTTPDEELWIEGDETRLCQVVSNLLTNAAKYTPPGGTITVDVVRDDDRIEIRVRDNGTGIAPELLPRIFDLFVQGERRCDRSQGGLGLGLAIVRSLVAMHRGSVRAYSAGLGCGSEFVVRLPLLDVSKPPSHDSERNLRRAPVTARRILVVDDNEDAGSLLGEMLRSVGHEVVVTYDGPSALEALAHFTPEIAILDIGLPVMDGYQLALALRTRLGSVRLMALTGYGQEQDRARSQQAGFAAHFVKPVGLDKLLAAIELG